MKRSTCKIIEVEMPELKLEHLDPLLDLLAELLLEDILKELES